MKKIIGLYLNWRNDVLFAVLMAGLILLFSECDSFNTLVLTKTGAVVCGFVFAGLFSKWETEGKIKELSDFINEED